jgi:hypothetical protein
VRTSRGKFQRVGIAKGISRAFDDDVEAFLRQIVADLGDFISKSFGESQARDIWSYPERWRSSVGASRSRSGLSIAP